MDGRRSFFIFKIVGMIAAIAMVGIAAAPVSVFAQTVTSTGAVATSADPNVGVAAAVQSYFADIPVMIAIAQCESGPRQFAANGVPLYAGTGDRMVGVFQLDSSIHTVPALALGFDITTLAGNLGYARYLYGEDGTEPWISSFGCWDNAIAATTTATAANGASTASTSTPALTLNLTLGTIDPQVLILQQTLNQDGFTLATSGPGSPGNETTKFGALTYAALKTFQCTEGIACSGDEATTGYGLLNAQTRAALLAFVPPGSVTVVVAPVATTTAATNPAEVSSLQSRIAALVVIVQQLEAEIAARA